MAKAKEIESGNVTSRKWVFNLVLFAVLFVVVIALFHTFVFSDRMLYGSDTIQAGVFFRSFYVDYVHENGSVPVWNPYQFCGIPYIDGFHGDTFYPFSILKFFTNIYRALGWNLLLHVFLAGITMFACARAFKKSQMAATLAAVGYMFAAYFVSQVSPGHDGKMFVTSLFPLTIMLIELAFERKPLLHFSLLGLVIGIIILTPHPQMAYYVLWVCAFYVTFKLIFKYVDERSVPALIKPTGLFVVAVIIGLALSAIHFYPGYDYVKNYSPRSDQKRGEEWAKSWSLGPEEAASLIVPEFCGVSGDEGNSYWGRNAFKDNSEYAGAVPLMMALFAVVMIRSRKTWFFGGLALFAVIYGLAGNTWFFYLFYNLIPNVKSTRAWSMIMFLFSFSISLLAAFALDFIIEQSRKLKGADKRTLMLALFGLPGVVLLGALFFAASSDSAIGLYKSIFYNGITQQKEMVLRSHLGTISAGFWKTFFFMIIPAAAIWLYSRKKVVVAVLWVVVAFALIDAYRFNQQFIRIYDQDMTFKPNSIVESIKAIPGKFRVLELTGGMLPTNYLPMFGIEELTSYHGNEPRWFSRLHLAAKTNYRDPSSGRVFPVYEINRLNNLADMTNTRYIMLSPRSPVIGGDPATLFSPLGA
ncbi:MAG: YfhO family protein, partial [FCB group bacterium]|nr:YfhO family protein [FCB group bacterium]